MKSELIVSLDLETTGLDPTTGRILEVGWVAARQQGHRLEVETHSSFLCPVGARTLRALCTDRVQDMHRASGLWADLQHDGDAEKVETAEDRWEALYDWLLSQRRRHDLVLLGFNPAFDRSWLHHHRPYIARQFHHRMIDVGVYRRLWPNLQVSSPAVYNHRALADAQYALAYYEAALQQAAPSPRDSRQ